jgi:hypothetical protein
MSRLEGTISITGLPPHRGLIVHVCFFPVAGPDAAAPHDGDPPAEAATDCDKVFERVDLNKESQQTAFEHHFGVERPSGYYYVQVRAIFFQTRDGRVFAQAEQFFFRNRPIQIVPKPGGELTFPVRWPAQPLEALHHYHTISPQRKRPWWRFW